MARDPRRDDRSPTADFEIIPDPRLHIRSLPSVGSAATATDAEAPAIDLRAILDEQRIQSIMDDFHALTGMVTAILDLDGNVLEATGWQDLCTKFHRVHPVTSRNCTESDLALAGGLAPGQFADYHCRNGLRDVVTPLYIRGRHVGNIFTGQFFYDDDEVDEADFAARAREHGFDVDAYMEAFRRIPRYSRETIAHLMGFLVRMTEHISQIGLANQELAREIRVRQEAEAGVREGRAQLQAVVHAIPDLVWMKDPDGVYLLCNERFEQFFGAPASAILGRTDADFLTPAEVEFFRGHDRRAMERGRPTMNIEEVVFKADGHRETLETVKTPIRDEQGRVTGVLGIGRDITARVAAEKSLHEKESRLRDAQRMESIGRLAAGVSHDLNNLLTPILGYAQVIAEGIDRDNPHREALGQISYAGERARDLVAQLLAFGRRQTLQYRTVDLNAAAERIEGLLGRSLRPNVRLVLDLDPSLPPIRADLGQIEQVIMNLALNAADAMPEGGELRIATTTIAAPGRDDAAMGPGPWVRLAVSDSGHGMDAETVARIFEPFFSTKGEMGTGLGLATVHGIVKQHGGEIDVLSAPGRGTTFRLDLPAMAADPDGVVAVPASRVPDGAVPAAAPESRTILLVEDNEQVRSLAATILERQGYRVRQAASGEEALPLFAGLEAPCDLLVTDVIMPGMTGRELYDKAVRRHPDLPVLFMSGFTDRDFALDAEAPRRERFLAKPFTVPDLVAQVRELLAEAAPRKA
ncbi:PocR ligand-binding domain-containing protein [bacterium]|nr:PocR ligand-binding domain-containing protein [bacterium]